MILPILGSIFVLLFFRFFISSDLLVANDWPLLFAQSRDFFPFWSIAWDYMGQGGIGASAFKTSWIDLYTNFIYFISNSTNIPWWVSQRIFWMVPFVTISIFSSYKFSTLFIKNNLLRVISSIIYSFNTYILLIVAGGQFGIAFSYALAPFILFYFINISKIPKTRQIVLLGVLLGLLIASDPRIAFLVISVGFFWYLTFVRNFKKTYLILISLLVAALINFYWLLPLILVKGQSEVFSGYTSLEGVRFLSFANFSNSISFLHPNWPENIFGKTYFLRPEFLLIPIFAFGSLLIKVKKEILFFGILALIGAFLGKGANEPFGEIYLSIFQLPPFNLFRDSTKFFILVALSYSILIPYLLDNLPRFKRIFIGLFIVYWLFILKPAWSGELTGIFKPKQIPYEYTLFNENIEKDSSFYRTLWVPKRQKYGLFTSSHPAVNSEVIFKNAYLEESKLQDLGVRYVIVPLDLEGEIFLDDRKYSEKLYLGTVKKVENLKWLKKVEGFGKLAVFEVSNPKDHFWSTSTTLSIDYEFIKQTEYKVQVKNAKEGDILVFSEGFDENWIAEISSSKYKVSSSKYNNLLNSFVLPEGDYELKVYYAPQSYVEVGLWISGSSLLASIIYLVYKNGKIPYILRRNYVRRLKK